MKVVPRSGVVLDGHQKSSEILLQKTLQWLYRMLLTSKLGSPLGLSLQFHAVLSVVLNEFQLLV